jgi:hypothetical protein
MNALPSRSDGHSGHRILLLKTRNQIDPMGIQIETSEQRNLRFCFDDSFRTKKGESGESSHPTIFGFLLEIVELRKTWNPNSVNNLLECLRLL